LEAKITRPASFPHDLRALAVNGFSFLLFVAMAMPGVIFTAGAVIRENFSCAGSGTGE
jgi:hypothetical protein